MDTVIRPVTQKRVLVNNWISTCKRVKKKSGRDIIHFLEKGIMDYM